MKNVLLVMKYGSMSEVLFRDLTDLPEVTPCYIYGPLGSKITQNIRKIHTSLHLLKYIDLPGKYIWYERNFCTMENECTHIVMCLDAFLRIGLRALRRLKKLHPQVKFVLLLIDSMNAHSFVVVYGKKYFMNFDWDDILSYDSEDCKKYGFKYIKMNYYSKVNDINSQSRKQSELFYIGTEKEGDGRSELLERIYDLALRNGVECDFNTFTKRKTSTKNGINRLDKPLNYLNVLNRVVNSRCILELVQNDQHTQTARYMEAVCYNKKLLTNNPQIFKLPYYNPRYMQYFNNPEDIDCAWILDREICEYNYRGDFSPRRLIDMI